MTLYTQYPSLSHRSITSFLCSRDVCASPASEVSARYDIPEDHRKEDVAKVLVQHTFRRL